MNGLQYLLPPAMMFDGKARPFLFGPPSLFIEDSRQSLEQSRQKRGLFDDALSHVQDAVKRTAETAASTMIELATTLATKKTKNKKARVNLEHGNLFREGPWQPVMALLDSGSSVSYARRSELVALGVKLDTWKAVRITAKAANGTGLALFGPFPFRIFLTKTFFVSHSLYMAEDKDCPAPVLLGSDFITRLNQQGYALTIDFHRNTVTIGTKSFQLIRPTDITPEVAPVSNVMTVPTLNQGPYKVRLSQDTTLSRRTNNIVPAVIVGYFSTQPADFLIEDNFRPFPELYIVGRSLVTPNFDGACSVLIMNPSNSNIFLYKGMHIASATRLPECPAEIHGVDQYKGVCRVDLYGDAQFSGVTSPEADWETRMPRFPLSASETHDVVSEIDFSSSVLPPADLEILKDLLRSHSKAFVGPDGQLGQYNGPIRHRIDLVENAEIPARKIYRVPLEKRAEIERQILEMLKNGIIRESTSPFCAPIVLVRKKDAASWRFTIDFRGLNAITRAQQSILPNIQDIVDLCANQC
ncbi:unnamed protein product, partial [Cylicostephanus goldi]